MLCWILGFGRNCKIYSNHYQELGFRHNQRYSLVNVKLKWAKDNVLDTVVKGERDIKAAWTAVSIIAADPGGCVPIYRLSGRRRGQLGLPHDLKISTFMRKYPNIFDEFFVPDSGGTPVPWFRLTPDAMKLFQESINIFQQNENDYVDRVCKLLMLTKDMILPLPTIDQLKWDLGLPYDYVDSLIPNHKDLFSLIHLPDNCVALKLKSRSQELAVSQLEMNAISQGKRDDVLARRLAFPIGFPRGYGLKRKSINWLDEWQRLPYTSPYTDSSHLDPRTDVSEKRIMGVFLEVLHFTIQKKTERQNVSNLREPLALPQKFTKVFERHPGIFYISKKNNKQTVVLREAYDRHQLVHKHPIGEIRDRFGCLMNEGFLNRSRGLYKKQTAANSSEDDNCENGFKSGADSSECGCINGSLPPLCLPETFSLQTAPVWLFVKALVHRNKKKDKKRGAIRINHDQNSKKTKQHITSTEEANDYQSTGHKFQKVKQRLKVDLGN